MYYCHIQLSLAAVVLWLKRKPLVIRLFDNCFTSGSCLITFGLKKLHQLQSSFLGSRIVYLPLTHHCKCLSIISLKKRFTNNIFPDRLNTNPDRWKWKTKFFGDSVYSHLRFDFFFLQWYRSQVSRNKYGTEVFWCWFWVHSLKVNKCFIN